MPLGLKPKPGSLGSYLYILLHAEVLLKGIILEAQDLHYRYPDGTLALDGLSLCISASKKIGIVGPNGAGKTTLFLMFNGVLRPDSGQLLFGGEKIRYRKEEIKDLRSRVGLVFQDAATQLFSSTVFQELSFGPLNLDLPEESVRSRVEEVLRGLSIADLRDKPTHFLSGGEKKKVAIASVLTMRPDVIVFDEPYANVDPKSARQLGEIIERLNVEGKTIVISTHDVNMIYPWADYIYVMNRGRLLGEGTPRKVFTDPTLIERAHLEKPWIVETYEKMVEGEPSLRTEFDVPRNKSDLFNMLSKAKGSGLHS
jgi:cobalt/nickel transport system ATP-binding protein